VITKIRKVYYCEFCRKHGLRMISTHEKHCTLNPKRECRVCEKFDTQPDECPMCEFSKLRIEAKKTGDASALSAFRLDDKMKEFFHEYNDKHLRAELEATY